MNIIGIGIDIIEIARVEKAAGREAFCRSVFTEAETAYAESRGKQRAASLAARWAAKEAVLKALGTGLIGGMKFTEIEITRDGLGKPGVNLSGEVRKRAEEIGVGHIFISLSHSKDSAIAECVLTGG